MLRNRIKELAAILEEEDLGEIEVRTWWRTIRVARKPRAEAPGETAPRGGEVRAASGEASSAAAAQATGATAPASAGFVQETSPQAGSPAPQAVADEDERLEKILAPMVGTFYAAADPQADPFVSPGTEVKVGQVICIIEAMKLMNEIEAETSGIIRKVLARDSQPVEFGQPLFLIESA